MVSKAAGIFGAVGASVWRDPGNAGPVPDALIRNFRAADAVRPQVSIGRVVALRELGRARYSWSKLPPFQCVYSERRKFRMSCFCDGLRA
jgi:hypothetical protein